MRRNHFLNVFTVVAWILPLLAASPCLAQSLIYSTGFEPPTFIDSGPLLGFDGWSAAIPPFLNPSAAVIIRDTKKSGKQSVEVWGGDLVSSAGITAPYEAIGSYRKPLNYTVSPKKPRIRLEADLLLETNRPLTPGDFFTATIAARSGDGETLGELGLSSAGRAVAYAFDATPGDAPAFTAPIELNRWHRLITELDFSGPTTTVYYMLDGELIGAMPTSSTSSVLLRGALVVYALPDEGNYSRASYTARFDNVRVKAGATEDVE